jgi:hypothetical protein
MAQAVANDHFQLKVEMTLGAGVAHIGAHPQQLAAEMDKLEVPL